MTMKNPPHPGSIIQDELDAMGMPTSKAAQALGVTRQQLHRITSGTSGISAEMAVRLEIVIGSTADQWLRLQNAFDLAQIRLHNAELTKGLRRLQPA